MKERKERIEKLLERYFEARTTDAEEQELKAYFREGETDPGLRYARAMFCGMDGLAGECLPERVQAFGHRPGRKRRFLRLCGIAAAAVVALGLSVRGVHAPPLLLHRRASGLRQGRRHADDGLFAGFFRVRRP